MGKFDKAIADFSEALLLDSKCALAYYNRANTYVTQTENAITCRAG